MKRNNIQFMQALHLIEEGDVLLFRGTGLVSRIIQKAGEGMYSHVGLATWHNGRKIKNGFPLLEVTEFREWYGGRTINLHTAYRNSLIDGSIDVYRCNSTITKLSYNPSLNAIEKRDIIFDGKAVTNAMREITGLPYGWSRIWWLAKRKLALTRWFNNPNATTNDNTDFNPNQIYPVCSTAVAACYSTIGFDLVVNRSDEWTEPSDISRSSILNYLFTLTL